MFKERPSDDFTVIPLSASADFEMFTHDDAETGI